jgi:excisionase family DNA binding protein
MKPLLNSKAVCELMAIKPATLSRMVHSNKIPYVLLSTGRKKLTVRFREEELELWLNRRSRGPAPKAKEETKPVNGSAGDQPPSTRLGEVSKGRFSTMTPV